MKEIKFRGKRKDTGEWVYGYFTRNDESGRCYITTQSKTGGAYPWEVDPATVGQYTGLKDKCGREIYTGQQLRITMYDHWDGQEIAQQESVVEFRDCKFGITWSGQFSGMDSFSRNVAFEVVDEEGKS